MTNRHNGASAGGRHRRALGPEAGMPGRNRLGMSGLALACLLLATSPALASAPESFTTQPTGGVPVTRLAMNSATPEAFTTALPNSGNCPQAAAPAAPPAAAQTAKDNPCLGALTGKLLNFAARKAGELLSVPVLVF